ncbi:hypothetical protein M0Q97_08730 [Candidatus Dojkabacteria bacterium]|jgi:hypothetical protein|nr:hypothetical protein [Candidatus Dojkabacteria bacterium]
MKEFYHVLIKNTGQIIHDTFATSHKDLIHKYLTSEDVQNETYFKAMFSPKENTRLDDVNNYQLIINETYIPNWFCGGFVEDVTHNLKIIISSMIIKIRKPLLLNEGAILVGNAVIDEVKHSIIFGMYDNSRIKVLNNGEIHTMRDETIIDETYDNTIIYCMHGYSKVKKMCDNSKILKMFEQANVNIMYNSSKIVALKGSANIAEMHDDTKADRLKHMSSVNEMHENSVIEEMWDWSIVEKMFDNARINNMNEGSKVLEMYGNSIVEQMYGNSIVEQLYENSLVRKLHDTAQILIRSLK